MANDGKASSIEFVDSDYQAVADLDILNLKKPRLSHKTTVVDDSPILEIPTEKDIAPTKKSNVKRTKKKNTR